jgi:hypothetical protein
MSTEKKISIGLRRAIKAVGNKHRLALGLGITAQAIQKWDSIPYDRAAQISKLTGIAIEKLIPELFDDK